MEATRGGRLLTSLQPPHPAWLGWSQEKREGADDTIKGTEDRCVCQVRLKRQGQGLPG